MVAGILGLTFVSMTTQQTLLEVENFNQDKESYYSKYEKKIKIPKNVYYLEDVVIDFGPDFKGQELKVDTTAIGKKKYEHKVVDKDDYVHTFEFEINVKESKSNRQPILKEESFEVALDYNQYIKFPNGRVVKYDNVGSREGINHLQENPDRVVTWTFDNFVYRHSNRDNKPTYFVGYSFGGFDSLSDLKLNDDIVVNDGAGEKTYKVSNVYQVAVDTNRKSHMQLDPILELHEDSEVIVLQTTIKDKNLTIIAKDEKTYHDNVPNEDAKFDEDAVETAYIQN